MSKGASKEAKATIKKLIVQRDESRTALAHLTLELAEERAARASLIEEATREVKQWLAVAQAQVQNQEEAIRCQTGTFNSVTRRLNDATTNVALLEEAIKDRDAMIHALEGQVADRNRELATNATLAEVKELRKRLHAKTEKVTELERELEKLRPTAPTMSVRPRVMR